MCVSLQGYEPSSFPRVETRSPLLPFLLYNQVSTPPPPPHQFLFIFSSSFLFSYSLLSYLLPYFRSAPYQPIICSISVPELSLFCPKQQAKVANLTYCYSLVNSPIQHPVSEPNQPRHSFFLSIFFTISPFPWTNLTYTCGSFYWLIVYIINDARNPFCSLCKLLFVSV